ncbi:mannose-1-phosphate guanylyltransferase/mannose-6-phosphate isomerase [Leclercia sp.]|uniref:mannose-1-phosphate guanylyltransferase/mannose-6-phosphate isomerase n=1 Tax=Leclercia sp. TaxID=1898428 RepID=UPI002FDC9C3C
MSNIKEPYKLFPVIMAGGTGSRLWPLSRELYPKQFLSLTGQSSMLQTTLNRLTGMHCENPVVICNELHRFIVAEQLRNIGMLSNNIILEPEGRNTAPAIALAALTILKANPDSDSLLLILAADHIIEDEINFRKSVTGALELAQLGKLVTFGIIPTHPETGYGYIKRGDKFSHVSVDLSETGYAVEAFVEKPDLSTAETFLSSQEYYWNSGMFLFSAKNYLAELKKYRPDILEACEKALNSSMPDMDFVRVDQEEFLRCASESIDYAVMENTSDAVVVPLSVGWSDVGSWSSLWDISTKSEGGNVLQGDVIVTNSQNNYINAESSLVAAVGIDNLVIVQTKDAVLVANKNDVQDVKKIVCDLKLEGRREYYSHREVFRPWGKYEEIAHGNRYKVKRITVKEGEGLSLRLHHHRSEHWVVVSGTARMTLSGESKLLVTNESVYIPAGASYSLENPGVIPLELIEVTSGDYLEEDDIVRFSNRYQN